MKTNMQLHREEQDEARDRAARRFPWLSPECRGGARKELLKLSLLLALAAAAAASLWLWRSGR